MAGLAIPQRQIDAFSRLTDEKRMLAIFRRELPPLCRLPVRIIACRLETPHRRTPRRRTRLVYRVTVKAAARVWEHRVVITAPVAPDFLSPELMHQCRAVAGQPIAEPFDELAVHVAEMEMALVLLPVDPGLPGLIRVTGPDCLALLTRFLPECSNGTRIETLNRELLHYRPSRSCVIRLVAGMTNGAGRRVVYAKVFADDRGAAHARNLEAVWAFARTAKRLRVPQPIGYDEEHRLLFMTEAAGIEPLETWVKRLEHDQPLPPDADPPRVVAMLADALVELQESGIEADRDQTFRGELAHLHRGADTLAAHRPQLAEQINRLIERLAAQEWSEEHLVPAHGGLHCRQVVGNHRDVTVLDWEGLSMAPRALDAGTFLGRLRQMPALRPGRASRLQELADVFRGRFLSRRGDLDASELAVYESMALTTRALRAARRPGRDMVRRAARLLAAAEQTLG